MKWILLKWRFRVWRRRTWRKIKQALCLGHQWENWVDWGGWHEFCTKCGKQRNHHRWDKN